MFLRLATPVALLVLLLLSSCTDVPVDNNTANVVSRPDTVVVRDTIVVPPDTVIVMRDSLVIRRDTIVEYLRDTTVLRDTVVHLDTVLLERSGVILEGSIFLFNMSAPPDGYPLDVDTLGSHIRIYFDGGRPQRLDLSMYAASPEQPASPVFRTPSWIYLAIFGVDLSANTTTPLTVDPSRNPTGNGLGVIHRREPGAQSNWYATVGRSTGTFTITEVNTAARVIRAMVKGRLFPANLAVNEAAVTIDSLALVLRY